MIKMISKKKKKSFAYIIFDLTVECISIYFIQAHFDFIKWWQNIFIAKIYSKFLPFYLLISGANNSVNLGKFHANYYFLIQIK